MVSQRIERGRFVQQVLDYHDLRLFVAIGRPPHHLKAHFGWRTLIAVIAVQLDDSGGAVTCLEALQDNLWRQRLLGNAVQRDDVINTHC